MESDKQEASIFFHFSFTSFIWFANKDVEKILENHLKWS